MRTIEQQYRDFARHQSQLDAGSAEGFDFEGDYIVNPYVSECGRFDVSPVDHYGPDNIKQWRRDVAAVWAEYSRDGNQTEDGTRFTDISLCRDIAVYAHSVLPEGWYSMGTGGGIDYIARNDTDKHVLVMADPNDCGSPFTGDETEDQLEADAAVWVLGLDDDGEISEEKLDQIFSGTVREVIDYMADDLRFPDPALAPIKAKTANQLLVTWNSDGYGVEPNGNAIQEELTVAEIREDNGDRWNLEADFLATLDALTIGQTAVYTDLSGAVTFTRVK